MNVSDLSGWAAAVVNSLIVLPQALKLLRSTDTGGLSLLPWQATLYAGIAWLVYAAQTGQPQLGIPNFISLLLSAFVIWRVGQLRGKNQLLDLGVPSALAVAALVLLAAAGPVAFSLVLLLPVFYAWLMQVLVMLRAGTVAGVSLGSLWAAFLCQALWIGYSLPRWEVALLGMVAPMFVVCLAALLAYAVTHRREQAAGPAPLAGPAVVPSPAVPSPPAER